MEQDWGRVELALLVFGVFLFVVVSVPVRDVGQDLVTEV